MKKLEKYQCCKRKCSWIGTEDEKSEIPHKRIKGLCDLRCPKCGGFEFYLLDENVDKKN